MARRSSARLRNRNSSTPNRVSLSHDARARTPRTAPVKLGSLNESDEIPGAFPQYASPTPAPMASAVSKQTTTKVPLNFDVTTPKRSMPIKPAAEDMHPKQHQQSTAKQLDNARWLGFANMGAHTEPPKRARKIATLQGTPTKAPKADVNVVGSQKARFSFRRERSMELSPEAKKLMSEKREEAAKIREQMIASGEEPEDLVNAVGRRTATPKSKKGRFSDVHMEQFKKMDSIAGHTSEFRADPSRTKTGNTPTKPHHEMRKSENATPIQRKSPKRSPSEAQPDEPQLQQTGSHLARSASKNDTELPGVAESSSPTKRAKRIEGQDVSASLLPSSEDEQAQPPTPSPNKTAQTQASYPDLSHVASPTQASLARATSVQSTQSSNIPAPALVRSPSKPALLGSNHDRPKPSTPLLARSPSKASLFSYANVEKPKATMNHLLMHSPSKALQFVKSGDVEEKGEQKSHQAPLLSRSPLKMPAAKSAESDAADQKGVQKTNEAPLLSRSPLKISVAKSAESEAPDEKHSSSVPFFARSPAKVSMLKDDGGSQTPTKSSGSSLMGRFDLLRSSPTKSILRSPQRLYSNDPAKVAAGTHLATPPKIAADKKSAVVGTNVVTAPAQKHVDFSLSTKARYERAQSEASSTPSKGSTSPPNADAESKPSPKPTYADYPKLPSEEMTPVVTPQKRRQTSTPSDFTFRAGSHDIIFSHSPNAPVSSSGHNRPSTIRHVSVEPQLPLAPATGSKKRKFDFENDKVVDKVADTEIAVARSDLPPAPATGSKKRKFDFENEQAADAEMALSDKENAGKDMDERPAKRAKPNAPSPTKTATRPPTLGVKPKKSAKDVKDKLSTTISQARLNALSQPKRRA